MKDFILTTHTLIKLLQVTNTGIKLGPTQEAKMISKNK
jgi:hypothetical protein